MAVSEATTKGVQSVALNEGRYRTLVPLAVLLVGFLVIQTFLFIIHTVPTARTESDGIFYLFTSTGPLFSYNRWWGPGFPWAIRLFNLLTQSPFTSAKLISLLSGILFIVCTYLVAMRIDGIRLALLTSIFIAFNPDTTTFSSTIMSDMLAASLFMLSLTLIIVPDDIGPWHLLFAGLIAGGAYITRYAYAILLAAPVLYLIMQKDWRKYILGAGLFYIGFIVVASPWTIFVWMEKGSPFYNEDYVNLTEKFVAQFSTFSPPTRQFSGILDIITTYPVIFVESMAKSLLQMPSDVLTSISSVGIIGALGAFLWTKDLDRRKAFFLIVNLLYLAILLLVLVQPRYILPVTPLVCMFVATSIIAIPDALHAVDFPAFLTRIIERIPFKKVVIAGLFLFLAGFTIWEVGFYYSEMAPEYVTAGAQLKEIAPKDALVIGWLQHIAYFANLNFHVIDPPDIQPDELMTELQKSGATYLIIDERYTTTFYPQFAPMLDPNTNPYKDKLRPVITIDSPKKVVIYQYLGISNPQS